MPGEKPAFARVGNRVDAFRDRGGSLASGGQVTGQHGLDGSPNHHGPAGDLFGSRQVFFHQQRREREHIPDVVEAVTGIIDWKVLRQTEIEAQPVPNRIVVFTTVEPPGGDPSGAGRHAGSLFLQPGFDPPFHFPRLLDRRTWISRRRHATGAQLPQHGLPKVLPISDGMLGVEVTQVDFGGIEVGVVALQAVFGQEGFHLPFEGGSLKDRGSEKGQKRH